MIPVERLKEIPLFSQLDVEELARLAPLFHRVRRKLGDILSRQGEPGDAFYVLESGALRVRYVDSNNEQQVLGYLSAPSFFGETSLMTGVAHDVTLDVFSLEADLLVLRKDEFEDLLKAFPRLKEDLIVSRQVQKTLGQRLYPWLSDGEIVLVNTRRHWYALAIRLVFPLFLSLVLLVATLLAHEFLDPRLSSAAGPTDPLAYLSSLLLIGFFAWTLGSIGWIVLDWSNDFYVITNKRVVHIEKTIFMYDQREEAPIEMVTNVVQVREGLAQRLFGFSDLRVETQGRQIDIDFTFAPTSKQIPQHIFEQINRVKDRVALDKWERLRAGIREDLRQRLAPDENGGAKTPATPAPSPALSPAPAISPVPPRPAQRFRWTSFGKQLNTWFGLRVESPHQVTWRKHWIVLIERIDEPLVAIIILFIVAALHLSGTIPIRLLPMDVMQAQLLVVSVWSLLLMTAAGYLWYVYEDWSNDVYCVTDDRVVDLERSPLGLRTHSIETTLDRVQDVSYTRMGPLAVAFNFGDLIIETAGAGRLQFHSIQDPVGAQQEIFRRRDAHRALMKSEAAKQERRQFLDWFMEYHRFQQEHSEIPIPAVSAAPAPSKPSTAAPASDSTTPVDSSDTPETASF